MNKSETSALYTTDFRVEFEAETEQLLRRRFLWFTGLMSGIGLFVLTLSVIVTVIRMIDRGLAVLSELPLDQVLAFTLGAIDIAAFVLCFVVVRKNSVSRGQLLQLTLLLVLFDGLIQIGVKYAGVPGSMGLFGIMVTHLTACLFLPWTPAQALRPIVPLLILNALLETVLGSGSALAKFLSISLTPLIAGPGVLVCWLRHSRRTENYKLRFFQQRYGEVRRELTDARRIHEALFPKPIRNGSLRFRYEYEPMRQIGGDYLYAFRSNPDTPDEVLNIVVMDVTGHGIAAALTVNRLYGELERVFAEHPEVGPGAVLELLNRYTFLTLASHSVYVTAVCVRVELKHSRLRYASGGHPHAYLRTVDGRVDELASTAFVLGVCDVDEFDPCEEVRDFGPGDVLLIYTDGATEAKNAEGRMLGLAGIRRIIASGPRSASADEDGPGWPRKILAAVENHRMGPPADDTLVVEICRSLNTPTPSGSATASVHVRSRQATPAAERRPVSP